MQESSEKVEISSSDLAELLKDKKHPIFLVISNYLTAIRGIDNTASVALTHIKEWRSEELAKLSKKALANGTKFEKNSKGKVSLESARDVSNFMEIIDEISEYHSHDPHSILSKSLFTQLFAEFDSYTGDLLKAIYLRNENLLKSISREISLSDLMEFGDLGSVKNSMLDKEIETIRRESYVEQFSNLEKKFSIVLRKFKEWPEFVELSQRRNVLMHNGGVVNEQYLSVCIKEGCKFSSTVVAGKQLDVSPEYFEKATSLLSKIGLMLGYTLWSKVFPKEIEDIHGCLNNTLFSCLQQKRWSFVAGLHEFVLSEILKKNISEIDLRIRIINVSIGLKFSGDEEKAKSLLDSVDWTASYRDFKMAMAILKNDFDGAIVIMKEIGKNGELIIQDAYHSWPLFFAFREHANFYDAYAEIYGEPFAETVETSTGSVEMQARLVDGSLQEFAPPPKEDESLIGEKKRKAGTIRKSSKEDSFEKLKTL